MPNPMLLMMDFSEKPAAVLSLSMAELRVLKEILEFHRDDEDGAVPYNREIFWKLLDEKFTPMAKAAQL